LLEGPPVDPRAVGWHWFAQCFAYVFRPNNWTLGEVHRKMNKSDFSRGKLVRNAFDVSVHVFRGDKAQGMTLVDDMHYVNVVMMIRRMLDRNVSVFLMTDDKFSPSVPQS
jgi:hypothetical protein